MNIARAVDGLQAYVSAHARIAEALPGGDTWQTYRRQALDRLLQLGWPTSRDESWKYVPLRLLEKRVFEAPAPEPVLIDAAALAQGTLKIAGAHQLVFVNGNFVPSLSSVPAASGIEVTPLARALQREPQRVRERVAQPSDDADQRLALLNLAFLADGAAIRIKADARAAQLYLAFVSTGAH